MVQGFGSSVQFKVDAHSSLQKCPWSHLGPKSLEMSLLGILFKMFLEGFQKTIFRGPQKAHFEHFRALATKWPQEGQSLVRQPLIFF